ncbi:MAG: NAD(+) synthase [Fretibacterium sp.]|nr:NAD(+) synthase [Fretibacterium sp.]
MAALEAADERVAETRRRKSHGFSRQDRIEIEETTAKRGLVAALLCVLLYAWLTPPACSGKDRVRYNKSCFNKLLLGGSRVEYRDAGRIAGIIEEWLRAEAGKAGARGVTVGLSGGIDSAVVAALGRRAFGRDMLAVIMPCHSAPIDGEDALLAAQALDIPFKTVELTAAFDILSGEMEKAGVSVSRMAGANLKARLRMATLYAVAQTEGFLVCGTSNRSEYETGYFTKYGDSASDLWPLADLFKTEVRAVAKVLDVPERIIAKAPTAGLWAGQTDEGEMGFSYDELDRYLLTGEAEPAVRDRIEALRRKSEHKRRPVPVCRIPMEV